MNEHRRLHSLRCGTYVTNDLPFKIPLGLSCFSADLSDNRASNLEFLNDRRYGNIVIPAGENMSLAETTENPHRSVSSQVITVGAFSGHCGLAVSAIRLCL